MKNEPNPGNITWNVSLILVISFLVATFFAIIAEIANIPDSIANAIGINRLWLHAGLSALLILIVGSISILFISRAIRRNQILEKEISIQKEHLTSYPKYNPDPVIEMSMLGQIIYFNPAAKKLFPELETRGSSHPYVRGALEIVNDYTKDKNTPVLVPREIRIDNRYYSQTIVYVPETNSIHIYGMDVTDIKTGQLHTEHINQTLLVLRRINQRVMGERNPRRILEEVCNNLIETRGFTRCWIMHFDDQKRMVVAAEAGVGDNFDSLREQMARGLLPACVREVVKDERQIVVAPDSVYCEDCVLHRNPRKYDCIVTPLIYNGSLWGTLSSVVNKEITVDQQELAYLLEMANDIVFAINGVVG